MKKCANCNCEIKLNFGDLVRLSCFGNVECQHCKAMLRNNHLKSATSILGYVAVVLFVALQTTSLNVSYLFFMLILGGGCIMASNYMSDFKVVKGVVSKRPLG